MLRSRIGGVPLSELNALERDFLFRLDFRLHVQREEYDAFAAAVCALPSTATEPAPPPSPPMEPCKHRQRGLVCGLGTFLRVKCFSVRVSPAM